MSDQQATSPVPPSPRWSLAFLGIAVLYIAGAVNAWYPTPDSALYQGLGRNLAAWAKAKRIDVTRARW